MDEKANGTNQAVEGNPGGAAGGSMNNPSPNAPSATTGSSGSTKKMDEQAGGTNGAVERNPDGSTGGSSHRRAEFYREPHCVETRAALPSFFLAKPLAARAATYTR
jgi:hypothetical protein